MVTKEAKIYIAGHRGMVGSAVWRSNRSRFANWRSLKGEE